MKRIKNKLLKGQYDKTFIRYNNGNLKMGRGSK